MPTIATPAAHVLGAEPPRIPADPMAAAWRAYEGPLGYTAWAAIYEQGYRAGRANQGRPRGA